jgi:predicted house-cleaning noncanonical NTP pyrophosphatase (MazG superfamily)
VRDSLSTQELAWVLGRSANSIRDDIRSGAIESNRIPSGFRIPKAEALRLAREKVEGEAERKPSDKELERLIDEVISTNEAASSGT